MGLTGGLRVVRSGGPRRGGSTLFGVPAEELGVVVGGSGDVAPGPVAAGPPVAPVDEVVGSGLTGRGAVPGGELFAVASGGGDLPVGLGLPPLMRAIVRATTMTASTPVITWSGSTPALLDWAAGSARGKGRVRASGPAGVRDG